MKPSTSRPIALIADDQPDVVESLRLLVKPEGFEVVTAASPEAALAAVEARQLDVALIDLNFTKGTTSGNEGLELIARINALDATLPVVVMTAWSSIELAVAAIRRGARDFVEKPWSNDRLLSILRTQLSLCRALRHGHRLEEERSRLSSGQRTDLIAVSPAMAPVLDLIRRIGPSDASVLITGEHGTGKEIVARAVHAASSRSEQPLITVNAGGLSEGVFASELFGHVKGAFTDAHESRLGRFEMADGATLFLDEIANVPLSQQAKLLRTLEAGELERVGSSRTIRVDTRVLSATNADLSAEVEAGRFREDLLFRLNTIEIKVPALRDRPEDIPVLAQHFLGRFGRRYSKPALALDDAATAAMAAHDWPGNVRELSHVIERAVLLAENGVIQPRHLGLARASPGSLIDLDEMSLSELEKVFIKKAMRKYGGNISHAARALGLSRSALYRRIDKHGL